MHPLARLTTIVGLLICVCGLALSPNRLTGARAEPATLVEEPRRVFQDLLVAPAPGLGQPLPTLAQSQTAPSPAEIALAFAGSQRAGMLAASSDLDWAVAGGEPLDPEVAVVRLTQLKDGLPIAGAGLVMQIEGGAVRSIAGAFMPTVAATGTPALDLAQAVKIARRSLAPSLGDPVLAESGLAFFNPELFEAGSGPTVLAYRLVLAAADGSASEVLFIDAHTGKRLLQYSGSPTERNRVIRDAQGSYAVNAATCFAEGGPAGTPSTECAAAFEHMGAFYDYFRSTFGRDSYDGAGARMTSIVRYGDEANAFWSDTYRFTAFGPGFATRDVVAHEWVHAVTQFTAGLIYSGQSGALDESFSDIFAAMVDRDDWLLGEDTTIGVIRDLASPAIYDQADKISSYRCRGSDNGGVHANSGISNKLAYLMAEGGSFNGRTISGVGREPTERIFYRALVGGLFPTATFADLHIALLSAAAALYGPGSPQYTATAIAAQAVELDQPLPCGNTGQPDAYESDDRPQQAKPIATDGTRQAHNFHVGGDQDWLSFAAEEGVTYVLETGGLEQNADTMLTLFEPDGATVIATNDDYTYESYASQIMWTAPSSGTFFAQVTNYSNRGVLNTGYQVRVAPITPPAPPDAYEPDDTLARAAPISTQGAAQDHNFHLGGDTDWVTFTAGAGATYTIKTFGLGFDSDTILYLVDGGGTLQEVNDDCGSLASCIIWTAPESGTFAVQVQDYWDSSGPGASYRLSITERPRINLYLPLISR